MIRNRMGRLAEETGLLNGREQAHGLCEGLASRVAPARVEPILWANSPSGIYTLESALQVAERIELAQAYAAEMQGWADSRGGSSKQRGSAHAASVHEGEYYRCGGSGHRANACISSQARCIACYKRGHTEAMCWTTHPERKPD